MAFMQRVRLVWRYASISFLTLFLFLVTLRAALAVSHNGLPSSSVLSPTLLLWIVLGLGVFNVLVVLVVLVFALHKRKKKRELGLITSVLPEQGVERLPKQRPMR